MKTTGLTLSEAIELAKQGYKIFRKGWWIGPWRFDNKLNHLLDSRGLVVNAITITTAMATDWEALLDNSSKTMTFAQAMTAVDNGQCVKRSDWTDKYVKLSANKVFYTLWHKVQGRYFSKGYEFSVADYHATDWIVIEDPEKQPEQTLEDIKCDRCGMLAHFDDGGGNCPECGDNLCSECGEWSTDEDDERCGRCRSLTFLPCKFCGGTNISVLDYEEANWNIRTNDYDKCIKWKVYCEDCGIKKDEFNTREEAIDWWNKMQEEPTLLNCPFCDCDEILLHDYEIRVTDLGTDTVSNEKRWVVMCPKCYVKHDGFTTKEKAVEWWNRRVQAKEQEGISDSLRISLKSIISHINDYCSENCTPGDADDACDECDLYCASRIMLDMIQNQKEEK